MIAGAFFTGGAAIDRLMPLHVVVDAEGRIRHAGPTLAKIDLRKPLAGSKFFDRFDLMRPAMIKTVVELARYQGLPLKLRLRDTPEVPLRGVAVAGGNDRLIVNLSFGIGVVDAVSRYGLTNEDFAPTDLAIEMLYLVEAKSAAFEESRRLNARLETARREAELQAYTDTLTGLGNRRAMDAAIARLTGSGERFGLMHVDLDFFKAVNDQLGHAAGDHVLQRAADILLGVVRADDIVARVGGDEFVLLLRGITDRRRLDEVAQRIVARLEVPIRVADEDCRISASIGTTVSTLYDRPDPHRMLRDSDAALYASKRDGRGRATHVSVNDVNPLASESAEVTSQRDVR